MKTRITFAIAAIYLVVAITGCAAKREYAQAGSPDPLASTTTEATAVTVAATPLQTEAVYAVSDESISEAPARAEELAKSSAAGTSEAGAQGSLETVYFDFDSYLLPVAARDILTRNARLLLGDQLMRVTIEGHADERGSDEYNLALADKRATGVARYLEALGVSRDRMESVSYGEDKPAVTGSDEATWAKNRRVEFVVNK